jgi:hypothetical protein
MLAVGFEPVAGDHPDDLDQLRLPAASRRRPRAGDTASRTIKPRRYWETRWEADWRPDSSRTAIGEDWCQQTRCPNRGYPFGGLVVLGRAAAKRSKRSFGLMCQNAHERDRCGLHHHSVLLPVLQRCDRNAQSIGKLLLRHS